MRDWLVRNGAHYSEILQQDENDRTMLLTLFSGDMALEGASSAKIGRQFVLDIAALIVFSSCL